MLYQNVVVSRYTSSAKVGNHMRFTANSTNISAEFIFMLNTRSIFSDVPSESVISLSPAEPT